MRRLDDTANNFLKALLDYYKPSKNRFSHQDLGRPGRSIPPFVVAGLDFIDWLLASPMVCLLNSKRINLAIVKGLLVSVPSVSVYS